MTLLPVVNLFPTCRHNLMHLQQTTFENILLKKAIGRFLPFVTLYSKLNFHIRDFQSCLWYICKENKPLPTCRKTLWQRKRLLMSNEQFPLLPQCFQLYSMIIFLFLEIFDVCVVTQPYLITQKPFNTFKWNLVHMFLGTLPSYILSHRTLIIIQ